MKHIRTRQWIAFPPAQAWAVLTDFMASAEWNPLNVWADGEARPSARVAMRFVNAGGGKGKVIARPGPSPTASPSGGWNGSAGSR